MERKGGGLLLVFMDSINWSRKVDVSSWMHKTLVVVNTRLIAQSTTFQVNCGWFRSVRLLGAYQQLIAVLFHHTQILNFFLTTSECNLEPNMVKEQKRSWLSWNYFIMASLFRYKGVNFYRGERNITELIIASPLTQKEHSKAPNDESQTKIVQTWLPRILALPWPLRSRRSFPWPEFRFVPPRPPMLASGPLRIPICLPRRRRAGFETLFTPCLRLLARRTGNAEPSKLWLRP